MDTEALKQARKDWEWEGGSPFVALLEEKNTSLQRRWNLERFYRLCDLGRLTPDELCAMVGATPFTKWSLKQGKIGIPIALNLQRIEDYVIQRRIGVHPHIRPEDAVLVKLLNREPEREKEPAC